MKKAFLIIVFLFLIGSVIALELPPEPMAFYGKITYNGTSIPNGYYLLVKMGSAVAGECEIISGQYGKGSNTCIILKPSSSEYNTVEFYLGNNKLGEHLFQSKEIINLDFVTNSLPKNFTPLSNGVCEVSKGECSYNILDCDPSKTSSCAGNGVCDTIIGETCTFTSEDCGSCEYCGDAVCNNGETCSTCTGDCGGCSSGGGGGGGGGGGSSGGSSSGGSSSKANTNSTTTSSSSSGGNNISELNTGNGNEKISSTSFLTGAVTGIGGFVTSGTGIAIFIGLAAVIIFGVVVTSMKKRKSAKSKNSEKK